MPLARYADALSDQSLAPEWPMNRQRPRRSLVAHVRERRSAAATPQATLLTASPGPSLPCNTLEGHAVPLFVSQSPSLTPGRGAERIAYNERPVGFSPKRNVPSRMARSVDPL